MEWFGDILKSDNDNTKKVLTENIHKKIPKADHERVGKICSGERRQNIGKECISRYGIEQRNMEMIIGSNSGPTRTVKLRKKKKRHDLLKRPSLINICVNNLHITIKLI